MKCSHLEEPIQKLSNIICRTCRIVLESEYIFYSNETDSISVLTKSKSIQYELDIKTLNLTFIGKL